jgi:hypothetical protein
MDVFGDCVIGEVSPGAHPIAPPGAAGERRKRVLPHVRPSLCSPCFLAINSVRKGARTNQPILGAYPKSEALNINHIYK